MANPTRTSSHAARPRSRRSSRDLSARLRSLEAIFADREWPDRRAFSRMRTRARDRAYGALEGADEAPERIRLALRLAAAELLGAASTELALEPPESARIVAEVEELLEDSTFDIALEVLRAPERLSLPPLLAVRAQLMMLLAFAKLRSVSLWTRDTADHVDCLCHVGEGEPTRGARSLASAVLAGEALDAGRRRLLVAAAVGRRPQPVAALVASATAGTRARAQRLMCELSPLLGAILERDALLTNNAESHRSLVESSERKLTRLGFDLHDGPIQDVAVLADDVRLLGKQLERVIESTRVRQLVRGRLEDVTAQLGAVDGELRRLSNEVNAASVLLNRSFEAALRDRADAFTTRTGVEPELHVRGDMGLVSASQQIALLNIVHESLSNIREHANASSVEVSVSADDGGVSAEIRDDGCGFDLESTLMRAAREGRIGLLAIHERARLLGGQCRIRSTPGGPTVVSVKLDLWQPLADASGARRPSASSA